MNLLKKTITGVLTSALALAVQAADEVALEGAKVGAWTMDYEAALKLAGEKEVPLLLNFTGSDWCGWCKLMDKNVFAAEEWKTYAGDNDVLVTLDFPKDKSIVPEKYVARNKDLQKKFGVRGYPTYVVLDNDGETKLGQLGAGRDKTPSSFIDEFKGVIRMSAGGIEAFIKANPDKAEAYKEAIAALRAAEAKMKVAMQPLNEWLATKPKRTPENTKKFEGFKKEIDAVQQDVAKAEEAVKAFH